MMHKKPTQARAKDTEQRFLDALASCLQKQSFDETTIDAIAEVAELHRGAFLKRFGSKRAALAALYSRYCTKALAEVQRISTDLEKWGIAEAVCLEASVTLERIQMENFGCNRAMHELFIKDLKTDLQTQQIFLATVDLMRLIQKKFLPINSYSDVGAFAATQLLTALNYYQVIKAIPGMPREHATRHALIAGCMFTALQIPPTV